jgi:NNMT/PNMT/TEMT family
MSVLTPALRPAATLSRTRRWAATVGATVASTYALDAVATAAGAALAASGLLHVAPHALLLGFLALSYVVWGAGLRANLDANWALLERTGTSTNALSKAAHDLAALRGWRPRSRRLAGSVGYLATELAKEAPYYAGAFGAALVSESVSSGDAIVFLAGANLGAAAYEYGLAGLTRAFLRRGHASFDDDWVPSEYLEDYYAVVEPDEVETIAFFTDAIRCVAKPRERILFFGTGPTLHHVFLSADRASEIHLADYLPQNLAEIERWLERDADAHDWRPFVRYTLECEGLYAPTEEQLVQREELTRAKVTRLLQADAGDREPVCDRYPVVVSAYCADSATADHATWEAYMHHIAGLVEPGGVFITAALRRSRSYLVGGKRFPSADVDEDDLRAVLEPEFDCDNGAIQVREVPEHARLGYSGIVLACARRRP